MFGVIISVALRISTDGEIRARGRRAGWLCRGGGDVPEMAQDMPGRPFRRQIAGLYPDHVFLFSLR